MTSPERPPLLEVKDLFVTYTGRGRRPVTAVAGVDLSVAAGETLGVVGESGCGKSTLARAIVGLVRPSRGQILIDGHDPASAGRSVARDIRRTVQMVFQDPLTSLNPVMTVRQLVTEPWRVHRDLVPRDRLDDKLATLLTQVGLPPQLADRRPRQFSGGQRQRIGIARALAVRPRLLVCDEPVSALDVSVQAQVLNLLDDLRHAFGVSYLFISHDLGVVRHLADRVAVMFLGRVVETGSVEAVYGRPAHPYTRALLAAATGGATRLHGEMPSPADPPSGCRFRTRCPIAQAICATREPDLVRQPTGQLTACHFPTATPTETSTEGPSPT